MTARFRRPQWLLLVAALVTVAGVFVSRREGAARLAERGGGGAASPLGPVGAAAPRGLRSLGEESSPRNPSSASAPTATATPNVLFAFAQPANAPALDAALPAPTRTISYVQLDADLITAKRSPFWQQPGAGRVVLPLPGGGALTIVIEGSEMLGADRWTSTGRIEGRPQSRAVFAWNRGFLHASIADAQLGSFALRAATEKLSQFYQVDPALVAPCGGERRVSIEKASLPADAHARAGGVATATAPGAADGVIAAAENPQRVEVHVMMVHTQSVLPTLAGVARTDALQSAFDAEIAKVNGAFATSQISARVKLVKIAETPYNENASLPTGVQNDALTALQSTSDSRMDELHAFRDQVGADLVCLALNRADALSSGLGFVLDTPGDNLNALYAFSVVQYGNMAGTTVVPHELGHNFGCAHDRQNTFGAGAYPYSYGYRFTGSDGRQYHDIMAYPPGTTLPYFSNPAIDAPAPAPAGSPGGVGAGQPGESNTALTVEQDAFEVAGFRLQKQAAPNSGTLVNVATRAFVGPGNQVLIGGFVLIGPAAKRMLIRAAGPALRAFGVGDALASPRLELFSGATRLQASDSWTAQPNAGDIMSAGGQAGAFAFAAGSADAALLVTLVPGAYTAVVSGTNGTTGLALVEAYEVGAAANKLVNLSTRGYADHLTKPMVGGFYVSAAPGTTKRVVVRVLGPSLERAPFNVTGALNDPFMELRNAAGELIFKNDDWSSGTTAGAANAVNDFSPLVKHYNEQQIAATGLAPGNRREPCVMLDLPPGSYTVIVKPFELRDPDPERDQPAAPGVGLIEVYEINP